MSLKHIFLCEGRIIFPIYAHSMTDAFNNTAWNHLAFLSSFIIFFPLITWLHSRTFVIIKLCHLTAWSLFRGFFPCVGWHMSQYLSLHNCPGWPVFTGRADIFLFIPICCLISFKSIIYSQSFMSYQSDPSYPHACCPCWRGPLGLSSVRDLTLSWLAVMVA